MKKIFILPLIIALLLVLVGLCLIFNSQSLGIAHTSNFTMNASSGANIYHFSSDQYNVLLLQGIQEFLSVGSLLVLLGSGILISLVCLFIRYRLEMIHQQVL